MDAATHLPTYRAPEDIAWVDGADFDHPEDLYLTYLPSGRTVRLTGSARVIWLVAAEGGDAVAEVPALVGRPVAEIAPHVKAFLAELVDNGLLVSSETTSA